MREDEKLDLLAEIVGTIISIALMFGICSLMGEIYHNLHNRVDNINSYVILK